MLIWCGAKGTWRCVDLPGFSQQIYQNLVKRKRQDSKTLKQRCEKSRITTPGARHQNTTCLAGPEMVASGVLDVGVLPDTLVQSTHPLYQTVSRKQGHNLSIPPHVKELATSCLQLHSKIIQKCSIPSLHSCCFPLWSFWMLDAWCIDGFSFTAFLNKHFTSFYSPPIPGPHGPNFPHKSARLRHSGVFSGFWFFSFISVCRKEQASRSVSSWTSLMAAPHTADTDSRQNVFMDMECSATGAH